jgi:cell division protein FtsQ
VLWLAIGTGTIVLLVAAIRKKDAQHCSGVSITIEGVDNNFFVDKKDILNSITAGVAGNPAGKSMNAFDLRKLEAELQKDIWVKSAQLFFDNNNRLVVKVLEREPVARVFTTNGTTFYIDSSLAMLPLSEKFSARLPVFTGFPSDKMVLSHADSALLKDILTVSMAILKDSFGMALIDQVDITSQRNFEMIPKIGNTVIVFGDATDVEEKLKKLLLFYKEVMVKAGWNKYSEVNLQFKGQVVAKRKGALDISSDSLRTLQLMKAIAENTERQTNDSLHVIATDNENNTTSVDIIQQSIQRDDEHGTEEVEKPQALTAPPTTSAHVVLKPAVSTVPKPAVVPAKKPIIIKPATVKPAATVTRPKVIVVKTPVKTTASNAKIPKAIMPKPIKKVTNEYR